MTYFLQIPQPSEALQLTEALAKAVSEAAKLCPEDQNYIAFRIMDEVAEENKWTESFTRSLDMLDKMAAEGLQEVAEGKTVLLEEIL